MRVPRLLVALAVAGALLSPAFAHRPPAPYFPNHVLFGPAVDAAIRNLEKAEVVQLAESSVTKTIRWGRYVRYGGALVIGASLVLTALDWFYNEARKSTGTSLDDWWNLTGTTVWVAVVGDPFCQNGAQYYRWYANSHEWSSSNIGNTRQYAGDCGADYVAHFEQYKLSRYALHPVTRAPDLTAVPSDVLADFASPTQAWVRGGGDRPPLPDWIQSHPDAADGVKQALTDYINEQDAQGNIPQSFAEPLPGLTLDPAPTGNQWYDNPFFNPYEDTDGDGWPDWFEWDTGADPSNAGSQPLLTADPDGDGYDNGSERNAGTDPTDPNSRPGVDQDQDADGDGLKDSADPCPNDPNNMCQPEEEENPDEIPDPTEPTLSPVDLPRLDPPDLPDPTGRFDQIRTNFEQNLQNLWDTLQDRFPVGMARWIPAPPSVSGGSCDMQVNLEIPDLPPANIDLCNNPVMQWAASTGRRIVLASLMVGFLFAIARRTSHA